MFPLLILQFCLKFFSLYLFSAAFLNFPRCEFLFTLFVLHKISWICDLNVLHQFGKDSAIFPLNIASILFSFFSPSETLVSWTLDFVIWSYKVLTSSFVLYILPFMLISEYFFSNLYSSSLFSPQLCPFGCWIQSLNSSSLV